VTADNEDELLMDNGNMMMMMMFSSLTCVQSCQMPAESSMRHQNITSESGNA